MNVRKEDRKGIERFEGVKFMCSFLQPPEMQAMHDECEPYIVRNVSGVSFKEGTPNKIKELFEQWKKEYKKLYEL